MASAYERTSTGALRIAPYSNTDYDVWNPPLYTGPCYLLPGTNITTLMSGDLYGAFTGTSAAAAHLSALTALLLSNSEPLHDVERVLTALENGTIYHSGLGQEYLRVDEAAYGLYYYYEPSDEPWARFDMDLQQFSKGDIRIPLTITSGMAAVDALHFYYASDEQPNLYPQALQN